MGKDSAIAWTRHTFNPWWGCTKVSAGCTHCYADVFAKRVGHGVRLPRIWGQDAERKLASETVWREPLGWDREAAKSGERARVFCASMADVFEDREDLAPARARLCDVIGRTPNLDWLLLTKRPENAVRLFTAACAAGDEHGRCVCGEHVMETTGPRGAETSPGTWARNIWFGMTAENQEQYDQRLDAVRGIPAALWFVSYEPALGPLTLRCGGCGGSYNDHLAPDRGGCSGLFPDWVIVGGESGPGARSFDLGWARKLVAQCRAAHVPIFVKQMGDEPRADRDPAHEAEDLRFTCRARRAPKGGDMQEWPADLRVRELPHVEPRS